MAVGALSPLRGLGLLLDFQDDEFGGFERREADEDIEAILRDVGLGCGFAVAFDEIGVGGFGALEGALAKKRLHEAADIQSYVRPQGFIVRFEDDPGGSFFDGFFDMESEAPYGDVFPLGVIDAATLEGASSPDDDAATA